MVTFQEEHQLYSIGELARRLGVHRDQATYAAQAYGIDPTMVAGGRRLYDDRALERIRSAVRRVRENQQTRRPEAGT